jgi:hypothetical protein
MKQDELSRKDQKLLARKDPPDWKTWIDRSVLRRVEQYGFGGNQTVARTFSMAFRNVVTRDRATRLAWRKSLLDRRATQVSGNSRDAKQPQMILLPDAKGPGASCSGIYRQLKMTAANDSDNAHPMNRRL